MEERGYKATTIFFSNDDREFIRDVQYKEMKKYRLDKPRSFSKVVIDIFHNGKVSFIKNRKLEIKL